MRPSTPAQLSRPTRAGSARRAAIRIGSVAERGRRQARGSIGLRARRGDRGNATRPRGGPPRRGPHAKDEPVDHAVGVLCLAKRGDSVERGEPIAEVHAADRESAEAAVSEVAACYRIGDRSPEPVPIVLDVLR